MQIQEDFSYVPRMAVSKFIELCDICALHRSKATTTSSVLRAQDMNTEAGEKVSKTATRKRTKLSKATADPREAQNPAESTDCATMKPEEGTLSHSKLDATVESDSDNTRKENVETV